MIARPARPLPRAAGRGETLALFLDIDGTIAEFAPRPELVRIPAELRALLAALRDSLGGALALVSGRSVADIDALLPGADLAVAGAHGLERRRRGERAAAAAAAHPDMAGFAAALRAFATARPGLIVEDKGRTVALHFRQRPDLRAEAREAVARLVDGRPGLAALEGKCVVEIKPAGRDKGSAIRDFMAEAPFAGRTPAFVGDDVTDEPGFAAVRELGGLAIRVGGPDDTLADWRLPDVRAARAWLRELAAALDNG